MRASQCISVHLSASQCWCCSNGAHGPCNGPWVAVRHAPPHCFQRHGTCRQEPRSSRNQHPAYTEATFTDDLEGGAVCVCEVTHLSRLCCVGDTCYTIKPQLAPQRRKLSDEQQAQVDLQDYLLKHQNISDKQLDAFDGCRYLTPRGVQPIPPPPPPTHTHTLCM
jgi:hypothetical protein